MQSNNKAVSQSRLNAYLNRITNRAKYVFEAVTKENAWARLNSGTPRKLLLRVASPENLPKLENSGLTVGQAMSNIGEALHAAYITVEISMGNRKGSLFRSSLEQIIRGFQSITGRTDTQVETLSVSVSEDDSGADMIDFLDEHLVVRDRLDMPGNNPVFHYAIRRDYLKRTFDAHFEYIHNSFVV